ncbi:uncharacterized protein JCM10292_004528 [Rhodotorula paludigena]|uniref:uncharacterized protein n=1 Tax=Rhodotorula paludigena TaxID=86838 RepID=UPI0031722EF5
MSATEPVTPPSLPPRKVSPAPSPSSLAPPSRPSFWERARSSTVGAIDAASKTWTVKPAAKDEPSQGDVDPHAPARLDVECARAARILRTFTLDAADLPAEVSLAERRKSQVVLRKIPPAAIAAAQGLVVLTVLRSGALDNELSGSGVVLARLKDGNWSSPSAVRLQSLGPEEEPLEKEVYDAVLVIRSSSTVEQLKSTRVALEGELSLTAGPVGSGMTLDNKMQEASIWCYVKHKGMYSEVSLTGRILLERDHENEHTIYAAEGLDYEPFSIPQGPCSSETALSPNPAARSAEIASSPAIITTTTASPPSLSPIDTAAGGAAPSLFSYFSRSSSQTSQVSSHSSQSNTPATSPRRQRRLPKEELDDEDIAAQREMEEAMKSFGIEDPSVNLRSRYEDPHLEVDERYGEGDPEERNETAVTGGTGTATPDLTASPGSRAPASLGGGDGALSDNVEPPPGSPGSAATDDPNATPALKQGEALSRRGSAREKPPVPPRRTPRIGTTSSAGASPVVAQGETETEEKQEKEGTEKEKQIAEDKEGEEEKTDGKDGEVELAKEKTEEKEAEKDGEKEGETEKKDEQS